MKKQTNRLRFFSQTQKKNSLAARFFFLFHSQILFLSVCCECMLFPFKVHVFHNAINLFYEPIFWLYTHLLFTAISFFSMPTYIRSTELDHDMDAKAVLMVYVQDANGWLSVFIFYLLTLSWKFILCQYGEDSLIFTLYT